MDGLIIKKKWLDLILSGKKTLEIRGHDTHKLGETIYLLESGSHRAQSPGHLQDNGYSANNREKLGQTEEPALCGYIIPGTQKTVSYCLRMGACGSGSVGRCFLLRTSEGRCHLD